jgi:hypothetical protein
MTSKNPRRHDLADYLEEVNFSLKNDYDTIRKRVQEDPGTAGDQAEETWAAVLRNWLPKHYHVVTKGRIIGASGEASPQIDILVLWPSYPPFLMNKKMYLASGIAAAFECKLTLRLSHLRKIFENSVRLSEITEKEYKDRKIEASAKRANFSYKEYHRVFEYGVLSHSFEEDPTMEAAQKITNKLNQLDNELVKHPNQMIDLICIQTLGSWVSERSAVSDFIRLDQTHDRIVQDGYLPHPRTHYHSLTAHSWGEGTDHRANFSPLGSFIARLYRKLSRVDNSLLPLANFFTTTLSTGAGGGGPARVWSNLRTPPEILRAVDDEISKSGGRVNLFNGFHFLGF